MLKGSALLRIGIAVALAACGSERDHLIGDGLSSGPEHERSRAFWQAELDAASGGRPLRLIGIGDSTVQKLRELSMESVTSGAGWAAALAANPRVIAVVGHVGSQATVSAAAVYARAGIPLVSPNATARALRAYDGHAFRILPDDGAQGIAIARFAADSARAQRVAVLYTSDAFGTGVLAGVSEALHAGGSRLVDEAETPNGTCEEPRPANAIRAITRALLARARPDAIVLAVAPPAAECIMREVLRIAPRTWILGADSMDDAAWLSATFRPSERERLRVATGVQLTDSVATRAFVERFEAHFGRPPRTIDFLTRDSYALVGTAVREAGASRDAVTQWLASLGGARPTWQGVTGPADFGADRARTYRMRAVP